MKFHDLPSAIERVAVALKRAQDAQSRLSRRLLYIVALGLFGVSLLIAYTHLPAFTSATRWPLFVLAALVGSPSLLLLSAGEYDISVRMLGYRTGALSALRVSVLSSVANLFPIPGSVVIRTRALRRLGGSYQAGLLSTLTVGLGWLATTSLLVGAIEGATGNGLAGVLLGAGGIIGLLATGALVRRYRSRGESVALLARIFAIETGFVLIGTLRYFLVLRGLGVGVRPSAAAVLTFAGVVTSIVGFFPQGLGIKEIAVAALSPLVGVPASVGLVAASIIRIGDLAVDAALTVLVLRLSSKDPLLWGTSKEEAIR